MVKNNVGEWDTDADNNTDVGGINIAELCPAANINNGMREMMAQTRGFWDRERAEIETKPGNHTAVVADRSTVQIFSGTATISLSAAATLGNGWWMDVIAEGGVVTIDPNGIEAINGQQSETLRQGESGRIYCSGTDFRLVTYNRRIQEFSAAPAATTIEFDIPAGVTSFRVEWENLVLTSTVAGLGMRLGTGGSLNPFESGTSYANQSIIANNATVSGSVANSTFFFIGFGQVASSAGRGNAMVGNVRRVGERPIITGSFAAQTSPTQNSLAHFSGSMFAGPTGLYNAFQLLVSAGTITSLRGRIIWES